mgnify:CR=1 FL=1
MLYRYDNTQREHKFFVLKTESDYHIINPNGCIFYYQLPSNILKQTFFNVEKWDFWKQFSNPVQQLISIKTPVKSANGIELLSLCLLEATIPSSILHNQMYLKTLMNTDGKDRIQRHVLLTLNHWDTISSVTLLSWWRIVMTILSHMSRIIK